MVLLPFSASLPWGSGPGISCNTLPPWLGQWSVELLRHTAPRPGGRGQWISCNALPHCLGAEDSANPAMHCLTAGGQWAVQLLQCTASLPSGSRPCHSCNALPHWLGAVGSATPALQRTGRTGPGGTGSPAQGVFGVSCQANGGPSASKNRAHRPGGDGEPSLGGVRSLL